MYWVSLSRTEVQQKWVSPACVSLVCISREQAIDLFTSIGVGAFRYSAALVQWTKKLERLEAVWIQAYKWAWGLPRTTASEVFTLPVGIEYLRIMPTPSTVPQT